MQRLGLSAGRKRSRKPTTKGDPRARFALNRLNREFAAGEPNSKWVTDTKAVETPEGWLYLAVILDLLSRMVLGWAMAGTEDEQLVELALAEQRSRLPTQPGPRACVPHSPLDRERGKRKKTCPRLLSGLGHDRGTHRNRRASSTLSPVLIHFLEPHGKLYLKLQDDVRLPLSWSRNEGEEKGHRTHLNGSFATRCLSEPILGSYVCLFLNG